jgi:methionyl-tRNA formyltransferase
MTLRVVFMGTPDFAVPTLAEIVGGGHEVVACYTRAPAVAGRGLALKPSPVQRLAERFGIPVMTPTTLRSDEAAAAFRAHAADVAVVVAFGMILPKPVLDAPALGCLNLHASLLPRWRGAAPIQRAIMAGDTETGAMVMRMDEGLDTGPVLLTARTPIGRKTSGELHDELARTGAPLMVEALRGDVGETVQAEFGVTYARKIEKAETRIDWKRSARELDWLVRGLSPMPGAWFEAKGERVKLLLAEPVAAEGEPGEVLDDLIIACSEGALKLLTLQRAGKAPMDAALFARGFALARGEILR